MTLVRAFFVRDLRLALDRPGSLVLDLISACVLPLTMYFLGRSVNGTHHLFRFVMAGLLVLRLHVLVMRTTEDVVSELITGTFELVASSRWSTTVTATAVLGFEAARAVALTTWMYVVAIVVLGAPVPSDIAAMVGGVLGVLFGLSVFAGVTLLIIGLVMVVRLSRAITTLIGILLPILAGAYFPVRTLPQPMDAIVGALPYRMVTDLFRDALLHQGVDAAVLPVLSVETASVLAAGLLAYRYGIAYARRHGTLGTE